MQNVPAVPALLELFDLGFIVAGLGCTETLLVVALLADGDGFVLASGLPFDVVLVGHFGVQSTLLNQSSRGACVGRCSQRLKPALAERSGDHRLRQGLSGKGTGDDLTGENRAQVAE